MEKTRENIDASVRAFAAEKRRSQDAHPEVEELTAYHEGELDDEAAERIRDHLALCEECARLVLDLGHFGELEPPSEAYRLSARDVAETKRALKERIRDEEEPPAKLLEFTPRSKPETPQEPHRSSIPVWYHGLVAALVAMVFGLTFWAMDLRHQVAAESVSANLNARFKTLVPVDEGRRGNESPEVLAPSPGNRWQLLLTFLDKVSYSHYRYELHDSSDGRLLESSDALELQAGVFSVPFPSEIAGAGLYQIKVFGLGEVEPVLLAEYVFTFDGDSGSPSP